MLVPALGTEQVRAALEEVLGWEPIVRSPQLANFLRYIVEAKLSNDEDSIKAYSIAVDVFGRPSSFDPQSDPIVRVQARRLRALLKQYYAGQGAGATVRIDLPVGRYVPEIFPAKSPPPPLPHDLLPDVRPPVVEEAQDTVEPPASRPVRRRVWNRFSIGFAAGTAIIGIVVGAVLVLPGLLAGSPAPEPPAMPSVIVGGFANFTGGETLDGPVRELSLQLAAGLARFEDVTVVLAPEEADRGAVDDPSAGFWLTGVVRQVDLNIEIVALLAHGRNGGIAWSMTIVRPAAIGYPALIGEASRDLVAALASPRGPLHEAARTWLALSPSWPRPPVPYLCLVQFNLARELGSAEAAGRARQCFADVVAAVPQSATAQAAIAVLDGGSIAQEPQRDNDLVAKMFDVTQAAETAVRLAPMSSFVADQLGRVLELQSGFEAARDAYARAIELNPVNTDARADLGLMLVANGDWARGTMLAETALTAVPSPPPWYYAARTLAAIRQQEFSEALNSALILVSGDPQFGALYALSAAPRVNRDDIAARYMPVVMADAGFRKWGILPSLRQRVRDETLVRLISAGLTMAGVPEAALEHGF